MKTKNKNEWKKGGRVKEGKKLKNKYNKRRICQNFTKKIFEKSKVTKVREFEKKHEKTTEKSERKFVSSELRIEKKKL